MIRLIIIRYFVYIFIGLEALILPLLLDATTFSDIEYFKAIVNLAPFSLLGSYSGFVYFKYKLKKDLYNTLFIGSIPILFVFALGTSIATLRYAIFLPILIVGFTSVFEKKMQVSNFYNLSILFKPLFSIIIILFCLTNKIFCTINVDTILIYTYSGAMIIWLILSKINKIVFTPQMHEFNFKTFFSEYEKLIHKGIIINLNTALLAYYLFIDRYLIKRFYEENLSHYSMAFNLAQFVFVGVNTLSYISLIDFGENIEKLNIEYIKKTLQNTVKIFLLIECLGIFASFIFTNVFNFSIVVVYIFIITTLLVGCYYVSSVVSPYLLYFDMMKQSTIAMVTIFLINSASSYIMAFYSLNLYFLLVKSGILLALAGMYNLYLIRKTILNTDLKSMKS